MNDEQLIEYLFRLCSESDRKRIALHLEQSVEDRARLAQLEAKFAQLDLIKEEVTASEQLITDTLRRARLAERPSRATDWPRWTWLTASAAVAALAFVLLVPVPRVQKEPAQALTAAAPAEGYEVTLAKTPQPMDKLQPLADLPQRDQFLAMNEPPAAPAEDSITEHGGAALAMNGASAVTPVASALPIALVQMDLRTLGLDDKLQGYAVAAHMMGDTRKKSDRLRQEKISERRDADAPAWQDSGLVWRVRREGGLAFVTVSNTADSGVLVRFDTNEPAYISPNAEKAFRVETERVDSP